MAGPSPQTRPVPAPTELTEPYWRAARSGRLALARCGTCGRFAHPPRQSCPACLATDWSFELVSGRGTIETFTVISRTFAPGFATRVPYAIAWVALPEQAGLRILSNICETPLENLEIGLPVEVTFENLEGWGTIPYFRALSTPTEGGTA